MRKVSAPALCTARAILAEYRLEVRPEHAVAGMQATEGHVAIVIDHATGVYKVMPLRQEIYFWQQRLKARTAQAPQLAGFLQKVVETFSEIPQYGRLDQPPVSVMDLPPEVLMHGIMPGEMVHSKSAMEAARFLFHYYLFFPLAAVREFRPEDRVRVAQLADGHLGLTYGLKAVPLAEKYLQLLKRGQATEREIAACFRNLGVYLESMPNFMRDRQEEMMSVV